MCANKAFSHLRSLMFVSFLCTVASAGVIRVDVDATGSGDGTSWASAYTSLPDAIQSASSGDQVWVAEGTYDPIELKDGVKVFGGFAGGETSLAQSDPAQYETIISGGNVARAVVGNGVGSGTGLRGFRITDGFVDFPNTGGGMFLKDCDATFVQCIFSSNQSATLGGAAMLVGGSPAFVNCRFTGNEAEWGAGAVFSRMFARPTFVNCLFDHNKAKEAGAVAVRNGAADFVNCTIADNTATVGKGGAMFDANGDSQLRNCIVWSNTSPIAGAASIFNMHSSPTPTSVAHSDIQGDWPGTGNLDADPVFVDPTALTTADIRGDYRLQIGSPCRDTGDNGSLPSDSADLSLNGDTQETLPNDLSGSPRTDGSSVDMGAYEWHSSGG